MYDLKSQVDMEGLEYAADNLPTGLDEALVYTMRFFKADPYPADVYSCSRLDMGES